MYSDRRSPPTESALSRRSAPDPDDDAVEEALGNAWLIRTHVVPCFGDESSIARLAASFPAALFGPVARATARSDWNVRSAVAAEALSSWIRANPTKPLPPGPESPGRAVRSRGDASRPRAPPFPIADRRPPRAVARIAAGRFTGVPPARCAVWCVDLLCRNESLIDDACERGLVNVLERAALPPHSLGWCEAHSRDALCIACENGHANVVRALALPPYSMHRVKYDRALAAACARGHDDVVRELASPPYSYGHDEACDCALNSACSGGSVSALRMLGEPPFSLGREDATPRSGRWGRKEFCALVYAASAEIVAALARPPYSLGRADAIADDCAPLRCACRSGRADVVRALSRAPYSLGTADARSIDPRDYRVRSNLELACEHSHLEVVAALGEPPYSLSGDDARANGNRILRQACIDGYDKLVRLLGESAVLVIRRGCVRDGDECAVVRMRSRAASHHRRSCGTAVFTRRRHREIQRQRCAGGGVRSRARRRGASPVRAAI